MAQIFFSDAKLGNGAVLKKLKRLSFKNAFRAAARAIFHPCNHAERGDLHENAGF
jgi:hypothetical protein